MRTSWLKKIIHQILDDLDGSEISDGGGERVKFALRGVRYQIDLSTANVTKLEKAFKPYIDAASKIQGKSEARPKAKPKGRATAKEQTADIREWARDRGYTVSDRGRIKADIVQAYKSAH
ncbi:histone-like nucleoid-structuring protein Lsr2 [Mycolicibacterium mageritense]|uniref:histone-like nucleoid-structuring protein Lsr2 n=1 Tax=Mycolicibacterium mageritense TaxID=53462 RepID=UPI0011D80CBE|nr:Lsr2 family protein [Mycolicibacterium mageritense]TXI54015.1 MAG: Lsr2 family protein [Mycolicibacterium mageritense]